MTDQKKKPQWTIKMPMKMRDENGDEQEVYVPVGVAWEGKYGGFTVKFKLGDKSYTLFGNRNPGM